MIDLHFVPTPNGQKVSILLEEAGLPHRLVGYDMLANHSATATAGMTVSVGATSGLRSLRCSCSSSCL